MNIFIGFFEAAGYFAGLSKALNDIGNKTTEYYYFDNKFKYVQPNYSYFNVLKFFYRHADSTSFSVRNLSKLTFNIFSFFFFIYSVLKFKTFIFSSQSFFFYWGKGREFQLLRFFKKKLVFIFTGSDSRAPFLSGYNIDKPQAELVKLSLKKIKFLNTFSCKTSYVIDSPSTSHLHVVPVIDFFKIGIPKVIYPIFPKKNKNSRPKIIHAPSVQKQKGSHIFRAIIEELKCELDFEYIEITNMPNSEVLKLIAQSDLVIDEMYSDSLMAGIACESAWLGTPYLVFGEKLDQAAIYYKWQARNYSSPKEAKALIRSFIIDEELRLHTASWLQMFVRENWAPEKIARRVLQITEDSIDPDLIVSPEFINQMCLGWGAKSEDILDMLNKIASIPEITKTTSKFIL